MILDTKQAGEVRSSVICIILIIDKKNMIIGDRVCLIPAGEQAWTRTVENLTKFQSVTIFRAGKIIFQEMKKGTHGLIKMV